MIKLPEEIIHIIETIEQAGYEAYAVGGCVRDSILGKHPEDWDLTSNASRDTLEALFPNASIINKKLGVMRISESGVTADIAAYRIDGEYKDYRRPETVIFTNEIDEDLKRRDFTMNAIAVNPVRGMVDPYHGRSDIEKKLIRGIGDPRVRFEEDALRILRGIRFASQLDFEIDTETLDAMKEKSELLSFISVERIREEFQKTIAAENSSKGLMLIIETGVLLYILGKDCLKNATESELEKLKVLCRNLNQTDCEFELRAALVYACFEADRAFRAIEILGYSNEVKRLLQKAAGNITGFEQIHDKTELKRLINRIGLEYFRFLINLSIQRCRVFNLDHTEIQRKIRLYDEIQINREPVFLEDLAVNGNDLRKIGIGEGLRIGRILAHLLDTVHLDPAKNKRDILLTIAEKLKEEQDD